MLTSPIFKKLNNLSRLLTPFALRANFSLEPVLTSFSIDVVGLFACDIPPPGCHFSYDSCRHVLDASPLQQSDSNSG